MENNNEDLKEGIEKIEGTLTNTKPKEKVFDEILWHLSYHSYLDIL